MKRVQMVNLANFGSGGSWVMSWEKAIVVARLRATFQGRRQRVTRNGAGWWVA